MIAALYVEKNGAYYGLPDVDPWDEERDARLYAGPWPVIAHPPCARWCQLASVNHARWGTPIGEDGGCFQAALESVRAYGGVVEHPAYSLAWDAFDLQVPPRGTWSTSVWDTGWVTEVSQSAYGHGARKRTWLYYVGPEPPDMDWSDPEGEFVVGAGIHKGECAGRRMDDSVTSSTPAVFRDALLEMARSASPAIGKAA